MLATMLQKEKKGGTTNVYSYLHILFQSVMEGEKSINGIFKMYSGVLKAWNIHLFEG